MHIAVACGGTGGHTFPGVATASILRERGHRVTLWLAGKKIERSSLTGWQGEIVTIPSCGIEKPAIGAVIRTARYMITGFMACRKAMRRDPPDVLLAMGSYSSVAPVLAARSRGIPVVLHEANLIPGRAVQFLARFAQGIAIHFAETRRYLPAHPGIQRTGMPIRRDIAGSHSLPFQGQSLTVLIMGGSQGATRINDPVIEALRLLRDKGKQIAVIHLSGTRNEMAVRDAYQAAGIDATVYGFLHNMAEAYTRVHLAITRAGASTCAELLACCLPAVLIPYPEAARDHQTANARAIADLGAATVIDQASCTATWLAAFLEQAMETPAGLARMRESALRNRITDGGERLATYVEQVGRAG